MIQIRAHVHQVLTAAHFGADKLHMGFLPFPGQPLIDVPDLFPVHLDLADGNLGPVFRFHKLEQVHQTLCRISFKQLVHMEPAILPCLDLQLPHQTGNRFRYRIVDPHRSFFPCRDRYAAVHIATLPGLGQGFRTGTLEIPQIRQPVAFIGAYLCRAFLTDGQFHRRQGFFSQGIQFQVVHFHPPESGTRKCVELFFGHDLRLPFTWNLSVPD